MTFDQFLAYLYAGRLTPTEWLCALMAGAELLLLSVCVVFRK